jgi:hypothetical protein
MEPNFRPACIGGQPLRGNQRRKQSDSGKPAARGRATTFRCEEYGMKLIPALGSMVVVLL